MTSAIRLNDKLSVIVTFVMEKQTQLTTRGLQDIGLMTARIYEANGLKLLGEGIAIRQPEDAEDDDKGAKLALARAVQDARVYGNFDKTARTAIYRAFIDGVQQEKLKQFQQLPKADQRLEEFKKHVQGVLPVVPQDPYGPGRMAPPVYRSDRPAPRQTFQDAYDFMSDVMDTNEEYDW